MLISVPCCVAVTSREKYEVVVVSPRNYFLYTPLLPAVAVGTMEERRCAVHVFTGYIVHALLLVLPCVKQPQQQPLGKAAPAAERSPRCCNLQATGCTSV